MDGRTINAINGIVNGAIAGGTFIAESSKKRDQEKVPMAFFFYLVENQN
jgi:hypothetical protein